MLKFNFQYAVAVDLAHSAHPAARDVLAQEHAQHRRFQGADLLFLRDVRPRAPGAGREQQKLVAAVVAHQYIQFIALWLGDFIHTPAHQRF